MIIIKLGGSVITTKAEECTFNSAIVKQVLGELSSLKNDNEYSDLTMILIHGAGSFGHILAKEYELHEGYKGKSQLIGLSKVHRDVRELNLMIMNELLNYGFRSISIPPIIAMRNRDKKLEYVDYEIFKRVLDMDYIPISFGDVVFDDEIGFSICSGDSIIQKLAEKFKPTKVIFAADVDGVFTSNPIIDKKAELIQYLTQETFDSAITQENVNIDVTGGIYQKAGIALQLSEMGIETYIINGMIPGRLSAAMHGEQVIGTIAKK